MFSQMTRRSMVAAGQGPEPTSIAEMRTLAEETGGRAFVNTNDLTGAIRQAVDDGAVTYTLGFYPDPDSLDGTFHKLKVRVLHHGAVDIRTAATFRILVVDRSDGNVGSLIVPVS